MEEANSARESWVEQMARLIRIRDARISSSDAEVLARAIWERPVADRQDAEVAMPSCDGPIAASPSSGGLVAPEAH